ncbi:hypothetical protein KW797_02170, partial [Candidatus Parcubacteria bacterium]|nr:hypothetical protein [Candidatus Parcubacteria bacterium]
GGNALADWQNNPLLNEVVAILPTGWSRPVPKDGKGALSGVEGKCWNRYTFEIPRYRAAEANEMYYSAKSQADFNLRIAQASLQRVESVSVEPLTGRTVVTDTMEHENLQLFRTCLCLDLDGDDRTAIRAAFKNVNVLRMVVSDECPRCSNEIQLPVAISELYPLA